MYCLSRGYGAGYVMGEDLTECVPSERSCLLQTGIVINARTARDMDPLASYGNTCNLRWALMWRKKVIVTDREGVCT